MRIEIRICPNTQVSRRLTCFSMAAYSRGDMRWRLVLFLLPEQKPLWNENQDPVMPWHTGEQTTDLFEHAGILKGWHKMKFSSLSVAGTENILKWESRSGYAQTRRWAEDWLVSAWPHAQGMTWGEGWFPFRCRNRNHFKMRMQIWICPDTQVSRRLTYLSMAAYSTGDMRWRMVLFFLLLKQKPLWNENQDPDITLHTGEQKTDLFEHGGILEGWHEVKVGSLFVTGTESSMKWESRSRYALTHRWAEDWPVWAWRHTRGVTWGEGWAPPAHSWTARRSRSRARCPQTPASKILCSVSAMVLPDTDPHWHYDPDLEAVKIKKINPFFTEILFPNFSKSCYTYVPTLNTRYFR